MTKIYLIRHAEAEGNLYRIAQGQCDSIITDLGYRQIAALAERFREIPVDAVYSSDLTRTCITAGAIANSKGLPIQKRTDLREICVGRWEEQTWGEIGRTEQEQLTLFTRRPDQWHVEGGESMAAVRDRMLAAVKDIGAENEGKTVAVFSHGCALRLLLGTLEGYSLDRMGSTPHGDNTAVSLVEYEEGVLRLVFRDDNEHVKALSSFAKETWWKRPNGVEPGLYFRPVHLPEQGALLSGWLEESGTGGGTAEWSEAGPALVAYLEGQPVGALQLDPEREAAEKKGWISFYYMDPGHRDRGLGIQLLGQAVLYYRARGREALRLAVRQENAGGLRFFGRYGFQEAGAEGGAAILEKDILPREWRPGKD